MNRNKTLIFTKSLYFLIIIGAIISGIIIYNDINNNIAIKFVLGYALLCVFFILYVPIITIVNARKLKLEYIKKLLKEFVICFAMFFVLNCILDYVFISPNIDFLDALSDAGSLSFCVTFIDVTFLKKDTN
ncbi:hypothetical protein [Clostridium chromiireducens]|uniref:Uncharacterized protein n=1 Tax=Clostridium chromiireducens TaxID=225345 RepID=A0A1V4IJB1_9CLOT|nr:hypothetical protein [Clostridium chromiireducens]OPJ59597.1 hypothetical protein CLCHR_33720 [Clostridium chromiireducens]RII34280.1 hypothetical protein D2A34_14105 [Clostridium chromiireducens]